MEPISRIDSSTNQLYFRGINVTDLSKKADFESVFYLLMYGSLPSAKQYDEIKNKMISFRNLYSKEIDSLQSLADCFDKIRLENSLEKEDALLAFVSLSSVVAASAFAKSKEIGIRKSVTALGHVANFLMIANGKESSPLDIRDFQTCLILHMDDPDNPSLSALSRKLTESKSISEGLKAALEKHVDVLHHGAGAEAMRMFNAVDELDSVEEVLRYRIENGEKVFGLGHRIYRGFDPRAHILREIMYRRADNSETRKIIEIIEEVTKKGRKLLANLKGINAYPNVDLYNAATYTTFGFPPEFNTTLFALARVAGWSAHVLELLSS